MKTIQPTLITTKEAMSQRFDADAQRVPVTILRLHDLLLAEVLSEATHGYNALKFAFGKRRSIDKPTQGTLKKLGITSTPAKVQEVRVRIDSPMDRISFAEGSLKSGEASVAPGSVVPASFMFQMGDLVDVTGISKGKGFQGGVKRHGFHGGPKTHGQSDRWRAPGSVGATTTPGRTFKGQRMAGRMGGETVTVRNLKVLQVDDTSITVQGLVPGPAKGTIIVRLAH